MICLLLGGLATILILGIVGWLIIHADAMKET